MIEKVDALKVHCTVCMNNFRFGTGSTARINIEKKKVEVKCTECGSYVELPGWVEIEGMKK